MPIPQEQQQILQEIADTLLPYFDGMPRVEVVIKYGDHFATEYCRGFYKPELRELWINPGLILAWKFDDVVRTLKHEMVHAWCDWKGLSNEDPHDEHFRAKAESIGVPAQSYVPKPQLKQPPSIPEKESFVFPAWLVILFALLALFIFTLFTQLVGALFESTSTVWKAGIAWGLVFFLILPAFGLFCYTREPKDGFYEGLFKHFPTYFCLVVMWFCALFGFPMGDFRPVILLGIFPLLLLLYIPASVPYPLT